MENLKIGVLTSGGDAPGMNACVRAVVRMGAYLGHEVYGVNHGYSGLIEGNIKQIGPRDVSDIIQRGGTILRTARSAEFMTAEGFERAVSMLDTFQIDGLIVIGGNGSLRGAFDLLKSGVKVIGLPGTIDNDMGYTDVAIGFDTAVNTALDAISHIRDTSESHERVTIIEVMGRECGDIAIHAGLAGGAEIILIPEAPLDIAEICRILIESRSKGKKSSIIVKAEGVGIDPVILDDEITKRTGLDVKVVVLSYIQRGGAPTSFDRTLASVLGARAVELLHEGKHGVAVGRIKGDIVCPPLEEAVKPKERVADSLYDLAKILAL